MLYTDVEQSKIAFKTITRININGINSEETQTLTQDGMFLCS